MLEFIKKLFVKKRMQIEIEQPDIDWVEFAKNRPKTDDVNLYDKEEREKYIRDCLEQIGEAAFQMEQLTYEYNLVTSYLTDMEEIEKLPESEIAEVVDCAKKIIHLDKERQNYEGKKNRLTEAQYRKIERIEADMPQAYEKLEECEEYQTKIKQDLMRLDGERYAYCFRKEELEMGIANSKGMTFICIGAFAVCIFMLLLLKGLFEMDIQAGYLIAIAAAAITMTVIFVKHTDYKKELTKIVNNLNQMIRLQNKVKIRYVNNTHLMDFMYLKYDVANGNEMKFLWDKFLEERTERELLERAEDDLEFYENELIRMLRKYRVSDPKIWIYQARALVDSREMVEIRHGLIVRRQKLRKQLTYNQEIASESQAEVKKIVEAFPQFAEEILKIVSEYESQYAY